MSSSARIVIVGAGLAGAKTAEALRAEGFDGSITLIGDEHHLPYERPPLSKGYLAGKDERDVDGRARRGLVRRAQGRPRLGTAVTAVDPRAQEVELVDGRTDRLRPAGAGDRLARRARCRCPAPDRHGVPTLRRVEDSDAVASAFGERHSWW